MSCAYPARTSLSDVQGSAKAAKDVHRIAMFARDTHSSWFLTARGVLRCAQDDTQDTGALMNNPGSAPRSRPFIILVIPSQLQPLRTALAKGCCKTQGSTP